MIHLIVIAPGTYDVEKSEKIIHQSSGAVTFGIKYKEQKPDDIPGDFSFVLSNSVFKIQLFLCSISLEKKIFSICYEIIKTYVLDSI